MHQLGHWFDFKAGHFLFAALTPIGFLFEDGVDHRVSRHYGTS
jgi:hypothetical protein